MSGVSSVTVSIASTDVWAAGILIVKNTFADAGFIAADTEPGLAAKAIAIVGSSITGNGVGGIVVMLYDKLTGAPLGQQSNVSYMTYSDWTKQQTNDERFMAIAARDGGPSGADGINYVVFTNPSSDKYCFVAGTLVSMADGSQVPIERVGVGDLVRSYDPTGSSQELQPKAVVRLFESTTETLIRLSNGLLVAPGHHFLTVDGEFLPIAEILSSATSIVLEDGSAMKAEGEYIAYSAGTADLFEQPALQYAGTAGALALAPTVTRGWKTYNFEVEEFHTMSPEASAYITRRRPAICWR